MANLQDQHQNRQILLALKIPRLTSLGTQPIATQIKEFDSLDTWRREYLQFKVPNRKVDQVVALEALEKWLRTERSRSEAALNIAVPSDSLPPPKRQQYDERLRDLGEASPWDKCFVRMYTAAEWAVEKWARTSGLECMDLNTANRYDLQDYRIGDHKVDVKTTISVGRGGRRELKTYWSPGNPAETGEIICAVRSTAESSDARTSQHYIQGIFHFPIYQKMSVQLNYFTLDKPLLNACYFHPPEIFFHLDVKRPPAPQVPPLDADVIEYCAENQLYLVAIFHLPTQDAAALLRKALPPCHHDFVPIAAELMNVNEQRLLPHYLADYLLKKIVCQESIDMDAVRKVLWSIFGPSADQRKYLELLVQVRKVLASVRCAHHQNEDIGDMQVEVRRGEKLILQARCSTNRDLTTTFLAYSRITGETLVYGDRGISVCDAAECGCLTHMYDDPEIGRRKIVVGRRNCSKYGEHAEKLARVTAG